MVFTKGNLLEGKTNVIAHQVNCKGVWGAGLAKQIKIKYPQAFRDYKEKCDWCGSRMLGGYVLTKVDKTIMSIFGQDGYGRDRCYTDYSALWIGFILAIQQYRYDNGIDGKTSVTIGIPYGIGCGLAGGDWQKVKSLLEEIEEKMNVIFIAYEL